MYSKGETTSVLSENALVSSLCTCLSFLPEMELAKAGALVAKALDSEVMGEPGGTPCPLLMALASAACPGLPTTLAD